MIPATLKTELPPSTQLRKILLIIVAAAVCNASHAALKNLCPNPSFELLNPAGDNFPLQWGPSRSETGKSQVIIDKDAHQGAIAVRMSAQGAEAAWLNSALIKAKVGKFTFHYKAIRSAVEGKNLHMDLIPIHDDATESGGGRMTFFVPQAQVGDGQWHEASLDFDFCSNFAVAGVLIAPRVNESAATGDGEWLVDDFTISGTLAGSRPVIEALWLSEPILKRGQPVEIVVQLANVGDQVIAGSRMLLSSSTDDRPIAEVAVEPIKPGDSRRYTWSWKCNRPGEVELKVDWSGGKPLASRTKRTVCISSDRERRNLCSDAAGQWRFMPKAVSLQAGNAHPLQPLKTFKSAQLPDSDIGITAHLPRDRDFEVIFEPEHLIDGDYQTSWSGRGHATPCPGSTDWVQIEFARPQSLTKINLVPYHNAEGFPVDYVIKARVGKSWQTVVTRDHVALKAKDGQGSKRVVAHELATPITMDAVRIEVTRFSPAAAFFTDSSAASYFRLSEVEAINGAGDNVALASKGAKVRASFTFRSYYNSREVIAKTYPELYNMGIKWNRVGQWGDLTSWVMVEQEKGKYHMDPTTDQAVTDSIKNGVNILYTLDYGNPLYEPTPPLADLGPVWKHGHPFSGDGGPTKPESIQGFVNYAKFIARHFKGRIRYYEIWNEENSWAWYGSPPDPKAFGTLLRETAKALKEIDPAIKVMVGGTAALAPTFITQSLEEGAGPYLDAIAFHPYTMPYPEMGLGALDVVDGKQVGRDKKEFGYNTYPEMVAFLKKTFSRFNPNLDLWADEWNAISSREDMPYRGISEISEAKEAARFCLVNTLLDVHAGWWSLANENTIYEWAVLRTGDLSRKPSYYAFQAMSTLLAGAHQADSPNATVTGDAPELHCEVMKGRAGETLVAVWSAVPPDDNYIAKRVSLRIEGVTGRRIEAVDTFHALVQKIEPKRDGNGIVIDGLLVPDYPIVIRMIR